MSKLSDKLRRIIQGEPPRIGFGAAAPRSKPTAMALMAVLDTDKADLLDQQADGQLDGIVFRTAAGSTTADYRGLMQKSNDLFHGLWTVSAADAKSFEEAGGDFFIFPLAETAPAVLEIADVGRALAIERSSSDALLRTLGSLPVDALVIDAGISSSQRPDLQWLVETQKVGLLASKPLLLITDGDLDAETLKALSQTTVLGLIVPVETPADRQKLANYRQIIAGLPPRSKKEGVKAEAILPAQEIPRQHG